jgi:hypothetical protein
MTPEQIQNIQTALERYPDRRDEIMQRVAAATKLSALIVELGGTLGLFQEFQPKEKECTSK